MPAFPEENLAVTPRCVGILGCQPEEHGGLGTLTLAGMELSLLWAPWPSLSLPLPRSPGADTRVVFIPGEAPLMEFRGRPHANSKHSGHKRTVVGTLIPGSIKPPLTQADNSCPRLCLLCGSVESGDFDFIEEVTGLGHTVHSLCT